MNSIYSSQKLDLSLIEQQSHERNERLCTLLLRVLATEWLSWYRLGLHGKRTWCASCILDMCRTNDLFRNADHNRLLPKEERSWKNWRYWSRSNGRRAHKYWYPSLRWVPFQTEKRTSRKVWINDRMFKFRTWTYSWFLNKTQFSKATKGSGIGTKLLNLLIPILGLCAIKLDSQETLKAFAIFILLGLCLSGLLAVFSWDIYFTTVATEL